MFFAVAPYDHVDVLSDLQLKDLELIGGQLLAELGYDTNCHSCDKNPNRIMLKLWLYRDYLRRGFQVLIDEIKRPKEKKWDDISATIIRAIKQRIISKY